MNRIGRLALIFSSLAVVTFGGLAFRASALEVSAERVNEAEEPLWRMTNRGWQDLRTWHDPQAATEALPPAVHPLIWTLGVLLLALGALIWSDDGDGRDFSSTPARRRINHDPEFPESGSPDATRT